MIEGIGIDIIELDRIWHRMKQNDKLAERILTESEMSSFKNLNSEKRQAEYLAGRFAAKEAFSKATGQGIGKLSFQHMEIIAKQNGAPDMTVSGYNSSQIFVSISHSRNYAIAQVIIEKTS